MICFGLGCNYILNGVFIGLYYKIIHISKGYQQWQDEHPNLEIILLFVSCATSFQFDRLMLKGLSKACKAVNKGKSDQSKIVSIKQLFNIMSIVFCCTVLIPMLAQAIYNLCFTHPGT